MSNNKRLFKRILFIALSLVVITGIVFAGRAIGGVIKRSSEIREIEKRYPDATITPSGLRYIVLEQGYGPKPIAGRKVLVNYTGTLLNGYVFDSSDDQGRSLEFEAGVGQTIRGFDEAVMDMREGEKRLIMIPPDLGYGSRSVGSVPGNSLILFELELFRIK